METLKQMGKISPLTPMRVTQQFLEQSSSVVQLVYKFQSQPSISELLNVYFENLHSFLPFAGIRYRYPLLGKKYIYGTCTIPVCNYQLVTDHEIWGDITIYQESPLTREELRQFELITSLLVHPLKTAINLASTALRTKDGEVIGLSNPELVDQLISREGKLAVREQIPMSIVMFNVDRFSRINHLTGHIFSDYILYEIMQVMRSKLRDTDLLFRYFDDTFCLILKGVPATFALSISERIRISLDQHQFKNHNNRPLHITVSAGVAQLVKSDSLESILTRANKALCLAKKFGRNHSILADGRFVA